jgi:hypothetical protein
MAVRAPNLAAFSAEDVAIVDNVIDWVRSMSAHELSELTHDLAGWSSARMGEKIPMGTALIPSRPIPPTDEEIAVGMSLAKELANGSIGRAS